MPIPVACQCGQKFKAKDELAGKTVKCPKCKNPLVIQAQPSVPAPAPSAAANVPAEIPIACSCGQKMKAKAKLFGKKVKCPKCAQPIQIPSPQQQPAAAPAMQTATIAATPQLAETQPMQQPMLDIPADPLGMPADPLASMPVNPLAANPLAAADPLGAVDPLAATAQLGDPSLVGDPLGATAMADPFSDPNAFGAAPQMDQQGFPPQPGMQPQPAMQQPMMDPNMGAAAAPNPAFQQGFGQPAKPQKKGLNKGLVIGLSVGGAVLLLLIGFLIWMFTGGDPEVTDNGSPGAPATNPDGSPAPPPFDPLSLVSTDDYLIARVDGAALMQTPAFKGMTSDLWENLNVPQTVPVQDIMAAQPDSILFVVGVPEKIGGIQIARNFAHLKFNSTATRDKFIDTVTNRGKTMSQMKLPEGVVFEFPEPETIQFNDKEYLKMPPANALYKLDDVSLLVGSESIVQAFLSEEKVNVNQKLIDKYKSYSSKGQIAAVFDIVDVRDKLTDSSSSSGQPAVGQPPGGDPFGGGSSGPNLGPLAQLGEFPEIVNRGEAVIDFAADSTMLVHVKLETIDGEKATEIQELVNTGKNQATQGMSLAKTLMPANQPTTAAAMPLIDLGGELVDGASATVSGSTLEIRIPKPGNFDKLPDMLRKMKEATDQMKAGGV